MSCGCYDEGEADGRDAVQDEEREAGAKEALAAFKAGHDLAHLVLHFVGFYREGEPAAYARLREAAHVVLDETEQSAHTPSSHIGEIPW